MDHSFQVSPGDVWQPESAGRFNRISDVLNRISSIGPGVISTGSGGDIAIRCQNTSGHPVKANTFVTIGQTAGAFADDPLSALYTMKPGTADPCGVVLSDCDAGEVAEVQISGPAEAAAPHPPNIFRLSGSGYGGRALVLLNSTGCSCYFNYFKVIPVKWDSSCSITQVKVIDGGNPDSSYCGLTDLSEVSAENLDVSGKYICLRLNSKASSDGTFSGLYETIECLDSAPDANEPYVILAEIIDHSRLIQRWTGGVIHWRNRFILPY